MSKQEAGPLNDFTRTIEEISDAMYSSYMADLDLMIRRDKAHVATIDDLRRQLAECQAEADDVMVRQLRQVKDEYEARIAALTQRVAQAGSWEPDDMAFVCGAATIGQIDSNMYVELYGETLQVELPSDIRLCQRRPQAQE